MAEPGLGSRTGFRRFAPHAAPQVCHKLEARSTSFSYEVLQRVRTVPDVLELLGSGLCGMSAVVQSGRVGQGPNGLPMAALTESGSAWVRIR
jgi:hypothetical protein